ncbi:MAG: glycosyltransferase [Peptostreptococcaceae bacterium]|nr:glycosyltransferase [Peptostreptococcaceae bacterium]
MKILLLTGKFGMGHFTAAQALEQKIRPILEKKDELYLVDIFEHTYGDFAELIYKSYRTFIHKGAPLYNMAYKKATQGFENSAVLSKIYRSLQEAISRLLSSERPDLVISTYSVASMLVSDYKIETGASFVSVTAITDVSPHDSWVNKATDHYLVADEQSREYLYLKQVPREKITISGIPVTKKFEEYLFKRNRRSADPKEKRLLVMGGGLGLLPRSIAFYRELNDLKEVKTTVVTAKNESLFKKLRGRFENIEVLGYRQDIFSMMRQADLLLTKAGGISTFEAICTRTPLIVFRPFLEQETANAKLILQHRIGIVLEQGLERADEAILSIERLLKNNRERQHMRERMAQLSKEWDINAIVSLIQDQKMGRSA